MQILSVLFCGDFAPVRGFESFTLENGAEGFGALRSDISESDVSFLNLETPLCTSSVSARCAPPCTGVINCDCRRPRYIGYRGGHFGTKASSMERFGEAPDRS